jgi:hypothetical protein
VIAFFRHSPTEVVSAPSGTGQVEACKLGLFGDKSYLIRGERSEESLIEKIGKPEAEPWRRTGRKSSR